MNWERVTLAMTVLSGSALVGLAVEAERYGLAATGTLIVLFLLAIISSGDV